MDMSTISADIISQLREAGCLIISFYFAVIVIKTILPIVDRLLDQHDRHISRLIELIDLTNLGIDDRD